MDIVVVSAYMAIVVILAIHAKHYVESFKPPKFKPGDFARHNEDGKIALIRRYEKGCYTYIFYNSLSYEHKCDRIYFDQVYSKILPTAPRR